MPSRYVVNSGAMHRLLLMRASHHQLSKMAAAVTFWAKSPVNQDDKSRTIAGQYKAPSLPPVVLGVCGPTVVLHPRAPGVRTFPRTGMKKEDHGQLEGASVSEKT